MVSRETAGWIGVVVLALGALLATVGCDEDAPDVAREADDAVDFFVNRFAVVRDLAYGEETSQRLDLYLQGRYIGEPDFFAPVEGTRPLVIWIHGGGWLDGDKGDEAPNLLPLVQLGWHVASLNYTLGEGTAPQAVDDVVCALQWLVDQAGEYGFDRERIVVSGPSAGGHLSLMTGILGSQDDHPCAPGGDFAVRAVVSWYGQTDLAGVDRFLRETNPDGNYVAGWVGPGEPVEPVSEAYSPLFLVDERTPPILTIHGTADAVTPYDQAVALHDRLDAVGVPNRLHTIEGGNHGGFSDVEFDAALRTMVEFLEGVDVTPVVE